MKKSHRHTQENKDNRKAQRRQWIVRFFALFLTVLLVAGTLYYTLLSFFGVL